ncbi:VOC family protein [Luteibacter sp. 9135]|jgi:predicted enzyme related to lactoylglutathione lyase|uniref:VOC family protein n=1 Tax=Luteibacter sp. 9135 TaxID=1500893 RepID=UPI00056742FA|nr:VOC family protein [Luteibacter sp. 9135]
MAIPLVRIIIYVRDVAKVKAFYRTNFELPVVEEIDDEWVVLQAGGIELALHRMGARYRNTTASSASPAQDERTGPTTKFVFAITSDLAAHRARLEAAGITVGDMKRYEGFPYDMYDGRDPEGNVFQVMRLD